MVILLNLNKVSNIMHYKLQKLENTVLNITLFCQMVNVIRILIEIFKIHIELIPFVHYINQNLISLDLLKEIIIFNAFWSLIFYTIIWVLKIILNK